MSALLQPLALLTLARPRQWIKNFFVLAPVLFARELFQAEPMLLAVRAFAAFCCASSVVYILNDITDLSSDRAHPEKRHRPLAAGVVTVAQALAAATVFLLLAAALAWGMNGLFQISLALYIGLNMLYSVRLKDVVLLDVFLIAAGFMLRVLGGAFAIEVHVSSWIVLCTLFISLFLGFAKRRVELAAQKGSNAGATRKVLGLYTVGFIDQLLTIAAAGTVISYALYTVAPRTVEALGTEHMIYTTVFVLYGVFRYLYLVHTTRMAENPAAAVMADRGILAVTLLWVLACILLIYGGAR
jgi:4-hydroxybenzoate polyprenyltransferase